MKDPLMTRIMNRVENEYGGQCGKYIIEDDGVLRYGSRLCVPDVNDLRKEIMTEAHYSAYSIHPGITRMYHDIQDNYWWKGMKKDIALFVANCQQCQKVKFEHHKPPGLSQKIEVPIWKWDRIAMDFVTGFPRTRIDHDAI